jgi:hypothetical protein
MNAGFREMTKAHSAMQDNTANNRIPVTALNAMSREEFVAALGCCSRALQIW